MRSKAKKLAVSAQIAAIYAALCYLQNLLLPGSASLTIQFRAAEALTVLCFFTPAAIGGLSVGCLLFGLSLAGAMPLDVLMGTAATALGGFLMYVLRRRTVKDIPIFGLLMPALSNGLLVGWELSFHVGGGFLINCAYVALGELAVLGTLGLLLYRVMKKRKLHLKLFA